MNTISLLRILGILAIVGSGISFLFEGWSNLTDLGKYLLFFAFVSIIFLFSETTRKKDFSLILSSLFIILIPAIFAQLGSFGLDQMHQISERVTTFLPLQTRDAAPVLLTTVTSVLLLIPMIFRSLIRLGSSHRMVDLTYFILSGSLFLIPNRGSLFHALILLGLFLSMAGIHRWVRMDSLATEYGFALRSAVIFVFLGRACLYEVDDVLIAFVYFLLALIFLTLLPESLKRLKLDKLAIGVGFVFMIFASKKILLSMNVNDATLSFIFTANLLIFTIMLLKDTVRVGIGFVAFLCWWKMITSFLIGDETFIPGILSFIVPICLLVLSIYLKKRAGVLNGAGLVGVLILFHLIRIISFPETNVWIILGAIGLSLFALDLFFERYGAVVGAKYKNLMNDLD